jgi:hypothetical protein
MLGVDPDSSRRIVWMIIGMIKAHPTEKSDAKASEVPRRRLAVSWWASTHPAVSRSRRWFSRRRGQADQLGAHLPQPGPLWRCSTVALT